MSDLNLINVALKADLEQFFAEDDLSRNINYSSSLPSKKVKSLLKIKDDMTLAGLPWFVESFKYLGADISWDSFKEFEGQSFKKSDNVVIDFELPFNIALTGERIALNLLQRASSIATFTNQFVELAGDKNISILDTRKTTPGLRSLEKYAVRQGGGFNHRLGQADMWMVKDNHKTFFGGVKEAVDFFKSMQSFYTPIEVEIHSIEELQEARELGIKHFMLDNFTPSEIQKAIDIKPTDATFEVSGGINLENIEGYLIDGVDAISIGSITYGARPVDLSLKMEML